jgi:hypothetical protein
MSCITAATFQGWMKDRIPGWLPYILADGLFLLALLLWLATVAVHREPLIRAPRRSAVPVVVLALILLPALYLLAPGTPLAVEAAGVRSWSLFPFAFLLALGVTRSPGQVRAYVGLLLLLCAVTAAYGIWQYWRGPEGALQAPLASLRHGSTVFYHVPQSNTVDFRAFSTFTYPAPFAAMMVYGMLLAIGIVTSVDRPRRQRIVAGLMLPLLFVAMSVSGTRAALVTLAAGVIVLGLLRGLSVPQLLTIPLLLGALHLATLLTAGRVLNRLTSVVDEALLWGYVAAPVSTAAAALQDSFLGHGLGRSGVGVPYFIVADLPADFFFYGDGDLGRVTSELGVMGLVWLALLIFGVLPAAWKSARLLVRTGETDLGLGIGALILSTSLILLIGSPLSTSPHGIIWWFLLGAGVRLALDREEEPRTAHGEPPMRRGG